MINKRIGSLATVACAIVSDDEKDFLDEQEEIEVSLYWSNEDGWVGFLDADFFSPEEVSLIELPLGGRWVTVDIETEFRYINGAYVTTEIITTESV